MKGEIFMKYIQVKEGQYLDKNGYIICPICGRKKVLYGMTEN